MAPAGSGTTDDVLPRTSLLVLIWVCFSTACFFVALRTIIRVCSPPSTGRLWALEDCWISLALACLLALCILETVQLPSLYYITSVLSGDFAHMSFEGVVSHTKNYLRYQFSIVIVFWTVLWSVKGAFLALYWRLFRDLTWYRRAWFVLTAFTVLAYGGCVTTLALSCGPDVRDFFGFNTCAGPENVWSSNFSVYFSTAVDIFTDLCIMAMPLRLIYNVRVAPEQKLGLVCVFSLGSVMIVFAIIRASQSLAEQGFVNLSLLLVWSTLAASISVLVGTLPALKVLMTTRARASENRSGDASRATQPKHSSLSTHKSVKSTESAALSSLGGDSNNAKSAAGSGSDIAESQEEMLVQ
ncbi:hypothetical protein VTH06DRAFT_5610 [Thermothelomyces fergusii]